MEHYALQLTLYSMALEAQEAGRPEAQRRPSCRPLCSWPRLGAWSR